MKQQELFARTTLVPPSCTPGTCETCDAQCGHRHASGLRCTNLRAADEGARGACGPNTPHMAKRPDGITVAWALADSQWFPDPERLWQGRPWSGWSRGQYDDKGGA